jgi:hypothetical protein
MCKSSETRAGLAGEFLHLRAKQAWVRRCWKSTPRKRHDHDTAQASAPLTFTRTLTTSIPDEKNESREADVMPIRWMMKAQQITVPMPADLRTVSGSKTYPIEGDLED